MKGVIRGILTLLVAAEMWAVPMAAAVETSAVKVTVSRNPASVNGKVKFYKGGEALTFGMNGSFAGGATLSWRKVGRSEHLSDETTYTLDKEDMTSFATGRYYCLGTVGSTVYTSDTVEISVIDTKVKIRGFGRICIGDRNSYEVAVSDNYAYDYSWRRLPGNTQISTTTTYDIATVAASDAGKYYCLVTDNTHQITFSSDTMDILVSGYPTVKILVNGAARNSNGIYNFCADDVVTLKVENTASGQPQAQYLWTGIDLVGASGNQQIQAVVKSTATYRAMITNNGCVRDDTVRLQMVRPTVILPGSRCAITGETTLMEGVVNGQNYSYQWKKGGSSAVTTATYNLVPTEGQNIITAKVTTPGSPACVNEDTCIVVAVPNRTYTQSVNDGYVVGRHPLDIIQHDTVVCARRPMTLEVAYKGYDGYTYEWMCINNDNTVSSVDTGRILHIESSAVTSGTGVKYFCKAYDLERGEYVHSDTVKVIVKYRPEAQIIEPDEVNPQCGGCVINLKGSDKLDTNPASQYLWNGSGIVTARNEKNIQARMGVNSHYTFSIGVPTGVSESLGASVCWDTTEIFVPVTLRTVSIASQLILPQATNAVQFVADRPEGGKLTWYPNGTNTRARIEGDGYGTAAYIDIHEGDSLVVVKMDMDGCSFYDTCIVLIREFTYSSTTDPTAPDDGFALSYPSLRVTSKVPRVCQQRDITLSVYNLGYDNYKYEWRKVGNPYTPNLSDQIDYTIYRAQPSDAGQYYCVATDPESPLDIYYSDTLTLTVETGPEAIIDRTNHTFACFGDEITIESNTLFGGSASNVADVLEWTAPNILSGQGTESIRVKVGDELFIRLRASKNGGCWSEDTLTIPVRKPQVRIYPRLTSLEKGKEVQFRAETAVTTFEWSHDGVPDSQTDKNVRMTFNESGIVTVIAQANECRDYDTARVFVKIPPTYAGGDNDGFTISRDKPRIPGDLKVVYACPDTVLTFRTISADEGNFRYTWWKVNGSTPTEIHQGAEYTFNVTPDDEGRYFCTVSQSDGTPDGTNVLNSDTLYLQVYAGPTVRITPDNGTAICIGEDLELNASGSATGVSGNLTYTWEGEGIGEGEGLTPRITVSPKQDATYTVRVSNGSCADTGSVFVHVKKPTIRMPRYTQLYGPTFNYKVAATVTPSNATTKWTFKETASGRTNTNASGTINVEDNGMAYVTVTDADGCKIEDSCYIHIRRLDAYHGGEDDGYSVLEVSTFVWIEPALDTTYVCRDNRLTLVAGISGLGRYKYEWHRKESEIGPSKPIIGTNDTLFVDNFSEEDVGHYYCIITDLDDLEGGQPLTYRTDSIQVMMKNGPVAKIERLDHVTNWSTCVGQETQLKGSVVNVGEFSDIDYSWSGDYFTTSNDVTIINTRPMRNGEYILRVVSASSGCSDTARVQFTVSSPEVKLPVSLSMPKPGTLSIQAEANGEGNFHWYKRAYNGSPVSTDNPAVLGFTEDTRVIVMFQQGNCMGFDTTEVFVKTPLTYGGTSTAIEDGFVASDLDLKAWVLKNKQNVCRGWDIVIPIHVASLGRILKYKWYKVGDLSRTVLSTNDTLVLRANKMSDAGKYYCEVSDPAIRKVVSTDTASVTMVNGPLAEISIPNANRLKDNFCRTTVVDISAEATERNKVNSTDVYTYEWFGESITPKAREYEISAVMGKSGRYIVKATMDNCYTYDTIDMKIYEPEVHVQPVVYLSKPDDLVLGVENTAKDAIRWNFYYGDLAAPGFPVSGDTLRYHVVQDGYAVVERLESPCIGYDTCRIFVKEPITFGGGQEDGFTLAGSGAYCKPLILTEEVCEGNVATIYARMVGDDFYRYKWVKVGEESRTFPSSALCKFKSVTKQDEGYYYCIITDVNNDKTITTDRVFMRVKELPKATIIPSELSVCYGDTLRMEADNTGFSPDVTYSYLWGGRNLTSYTTASTKAEILEDGKYRLVVSDGDCYTQDSVEVTVVRNVLETPLIYHVEKGHGLKMGATLNGQEHPTLTWMVGEKFYRNTADSLELSASSLTRSTSFTVSTTGKCVEEKRGLIYVHDQTGYLGGTDDGYVLPNNLPQILRQGDNLLGCNVDTALMWVEVLKSEEELHYQWQKYDDNLGSAGWTNLIEVEGDTHIEGHEKDSLIFHTIRYSDAGRYRLQIRNQFGITYSREVRLVRGGTPTLENHPIIGDPVCEKTQFSFITDADMPYNDYPNWKKATDLHWKWYYSKDGINFKQLTPAVDFASESMTINPCKEADEGYYMVEATNYCGSAYDTTFQEIWEAPRFIKQNDEIFVCENGTVEVTTEAEGGGTYSYSLYHVNVDSRGNYVSDRRRMMNDNPVPSYTFDMVDHDTDTGYYRWRVYNQCDTAYSKPFKMNVEEEIRPLFESIDSTICAAVGNQMILRAQNNIDNPTPTLKYYWEKDGVRIPNATANTYTINNLVVDDGGVYVCWAHHSCPEKQIKQFNIHTKSRPVITKLVELKEGGRFCESAKVEMSIDYTSDAGDVRCTWVHNNRDLTGDAHFVGANDWKLTINSLVASDAGNYYVKLANDCPGVTSSNQVNLYVKHKARIANSLAAQSATLCVGTNYSLSVNATGEPPITYTWFKNNATIAGERSATLRLNNVTHATAATYACYIQNECTEESPHDTARIEVITPLIYAVEGGGGYCNDDFREITLGGFEKGVTYSLLRRNQLNESGYTTLRTVNGDTVSTVKLTFGKWGTGYYHVEATARKNGTTCNSRMDGEIYIYQKASPKQIPFYVSRPMCEGDKYGYLRLEDTEGPEIEYTFSKEVVSLFGTTWSRIQQNRGTNGGNLEWKCIAGKYMVTARNVETGCEVQIGKTDTIKERPYPVVYDLLAVNGDTTACFGMESDVVLKLANSENTCSYTLYKDGATTDRTATSNPPQWDKVKGGVYSVHAVTNHGCAKDMGHVEVVDLPQLNTYVLAGDTVYCYESTGEMSDVVLPGSQPGIEYVLYHGTPATSGVGDTLYGTGEFLVWQKALERNETYTVVARDTHDMCIQAMGKAVTVTANRLNITPSPDTMIIISSKAHLTVDIKNAMGTPTVVWQPEGKFTTIEGTNDIMTNVLTKAELYAVTVSDDHCTKEGLVQVNVEGQLLEVEARASNCFTPIDTLYYCEGENISLCSFISGGCGNYSYIWYDDYYSEANGGIEGANKSKLTYKRHNNTDGYVVIHAGSPCTKNGATVIQEARDTVYLKVRRKPVINLSNRSLTCVVPGADSAIILSTTEEGVTYELQRRADMTKPFATVATLTGDGETMRFAIDNFAEADQAGYYQVKATRSYTESNGATTSCLLTGPALQVRRGPQVMEMSSTDITAYCAGTRQDTIYLSGSEEGVDYKLMRGSVLDGRFTVQIEQQAGTGSGLTFTGSYGTGDYKVKAVLGECADTMANYVHIDSWEVPKLYGADGWGGHCLTEDDITITLNNPYMGVNYAIYLSTGGDPIVADDAGQEALELHMPDKDQRTVGSYYMVSLDPAHGCTDTLRGLSITENPPTLNFPVTEFTYCEGLPGVEGSVIVATNADPNITYDLLEADTEDKVGEFVHGTGDTIRYGSVLGIESGQKTYVVRANAGDCTGERGSITLIQSAAPRVDVELRHQGRELTAEDTLGCVGLPLTMGLQLAPAGITFYLYHDDATTPIDTIVGENYLTYFKHQPYSELGTYTIHAVNSDGCESVLNSHYRIREQPIYYHAYVEGGTKTYCEGSDGLHIGIDGTQEGITYYLQRWEGAWNEYRDVAGVQIIGMGSTDPATFSGEYKAGSYRVRTDYCNIVMLDTLEITELPLPAMKAVAYEGKACIDSTMVLSIAEPEAAATYVLLYNGKVPQGASFIAGTDEVKWSIDAAQNGVYSVSATLNGCTRVMDDTYTTAESPVIATLEGITTTKCTGSADSLYLEAWERDVTYVLHDKDNGTTYTGKQWDGKIYFFDIPAGSNYFVRANRASCTVDGETSEFPGVALPEMEDEPMTVIDCQPGGVNSIELKNLNANYQYTLAGMAGVYEVRDFAGDTIMEDVGNGEFMLEVYDPATTCRSLSESVTVRAAIPQDSVVGLLAYCDGEEGVRVQISGQTYGVLYSIYDLATGELKDQVSSATLFNLPMPEGEYIYRAERVGLWGGCWTTDTFKVEKFPMPNLEFDVTVPDGALCAVGSNEITINNTQDRVLYMLQNKETGVCIDTLRGDGGPKTFTGRKPQGTYRIEVAYEGLCRVNGRPYFWKDFVISDVPPQATTTDCDYCGEADVVVDGCELYIAGLKTNAEYVLYDKRDNYPLDTLIAVSAGYFKQVPSGNYYVVGTYVDTKCTDVVANMKIQRLTKPRKYDVVNANGGGDCAMEVQVQLAGGYEGDSVKYYLYQDGFYQVEGPVTATSAGVSFRKYKTPGNYTVYAVKGDNVCTEWMNGSVVLYDRPVNAVLSVEGYNCDGNASAQKVTIRANKTVLDWYYFLSNGTEETARQEGGNFIELEWDEIGGKPLPSGQYVLYAANACDSIIAMDTISVYDASAPREVKLKRYKDGVVCDHDQYSFDLLDNERGVTYTLQFGDETFEVIGDGRSGLTHMGDVYMNTNRLEVKLYATVDTSQCTYQVDTLLLRKDNTTQDPRVVGTDICVEEGGSITISLLTPRVPRVDYYLKIAEQYVDTILSTAPTEALSFKPQTQLGCYSIYATSETRQCDAEYPARCMSLAPELKSMDTSWDGGLCEGESHDILVNNPQAGVKYHLIKDGHVDPTGASGTGESLVVGKVTEAGRYEVTAIVTDACTQKLDGSVDVVINPKPELHVLHEYEYIKGTPGVEIDVKRPTSPGVVYQIDSVYPGGTMGVFQTANEYGDAIDLSEGRYDRIYFPKGKYYVWTFSINDFKCRAMDSIVVKEIGVEDFHLEVIGTPYMCEAGECRRLRLSGSEQGAQYELYRRAEGAENFIAMMAGTGKVLDFGTQCDTGTYYVKASKNVYNATTGETVAMTERMADSVRLYVVTQIRRFTLNAEKDGYCYLGDDGMPASPSGSVILEGSQGDDITYQLYCNGIAVPGKSKQGATGGRLKWDGLIGRNCDKNSDDGNLYKVVATDGKCEVDMDGTVNIVAVNAPQLVKQPYEISTCMGEKTVMSVHAYGCLLHYEWHSYERTILTDKGSETLPGEVVSTNSSYVIDSVTMAEMGKYTCTISNYCNTIETDTVRLSVRDVVRMPEKMVDKMVCSSEAEDVQLVSKAVGENYYWYRVGSELDTLAKTQILTIEDAESTRDAGEYVCVTWNSCGYMADTVRLEFNRQPSIEGVTFHTDTLCVGSPFELSFDSRDTIYWYFDNGTGDRMMIDKHDHTLAFDSIYFAKAGIYKVKATNPCNPGRWFNVVQIFVDDTLKPTKLPPETQHYCEGDFIRLEVAFEPGSDPNAGSRIFTTWAKRGAVDLGYRNSLNYSIQTTSRDEGSFINLSYQNKCTTGSRMHTVYIDHNPYLAYFDKDTTVSVCAYDRKTEVIIRDAAQNYASYDQYHWYRRNGAASELVGETDTLAVDRRVSNTGIYYCQIDNACASITSADIALHIDTVPTITRQPVQPEMAFCEMDTDPRYVINASARGGDLEYRWYARKKAGGEPSLVGYIKQGDIESSSQCTMEKLTYDYDSCELWCAVENGCGAVLTDSVLLRIQRRSDFTLDRTTAYKCPDKDAEVVLTLNMQPEGIWQYYVDGPIGRPADSTRSVQTAPAKSLTHTLKLSKLGEYKISELFLNGTTCYSDHEETVTVVEQSRFTVAIDSVGRGVVCRGENVKMRVHVTGGEPPFRVDIRRDGDVGPAPEFGSMPVEIWCTDTVFELRPIDSRKFVVFSATQFTNPDACDGLIDGDHGSVTYTIQQPYDVSIGNVSDTLFGACQTIDLAAVLQPEPALPTGQFYVNDVLSTDNVISGVDPGRYTVKYRAATSAGCADSVRITLRIDPLPTATLTLDKDHVCHGEDVKLTIVPVGTGPFTYSLRDYSFNADNRQVGRPVTLSQRIEGPYAYTFSYDEERSAAAYRKFQLSSLRDAYGCSADLGDGMVQLVMRKSPTFKVSGRHSTVTSGNEDETTKIFVVPVADKTVYFMTTLLSGERPWVNQVELERPDGTKSENRKANITSMAWQYSGVETGTYRFTVTDKYCPSRTTIIRTITVLDTLFLKTKVLLEGAFKKSNMEMTDYLWTNGLVPLNSWSKWPTLTDGRKGVDWVTLELREGSIEGTTVSSGDYLLLTDGSVVDRYGREELAFSNVDYNTDYYLVVRHRNHITIGSGMPVKLAKTRGEAALYDMRNVLNVYDGMVDDITLHVRYIGQIGNVSAWAMLVGDAYGNDLITTNDDNASLFQTTDTPGYYKTDVDFDGVVTAPAPDSEGKMHAQGVGVETNDYSKIYNNRDKYSEIK